VPPYEILRTVRAAGFDPLAPPLRQGTSYVVRAIDFRGVAMRVVVDARSGAIRDANRIVSGPGLYGPYAPGPYPPAPYGRFGPPRYLAPPDEFAAYGRPPYVGASEVPLSDQDALRGLAPARSQYSAGGNLAPSLVPSLVPLPRPRPAGLAAAGLAAAGLAAASGETKAGETKAGETKAGDTKAGEMKAGEMKSIIKPDIATGTSTAARSEPLRKPASASAVPAIND
jgi:hypothetical protein